MNGTTKHVLMVLAACAPMFLVTLSNDAAARTGGTGLAIRPPKVGAVELAGKAPPKKPKLNAAPEELLSAKPTKRPSPKLNTTPEELLSAKPTGRPRPKLNTTPEELLSAKPTKRPSPKLNTTPEELLSAKPTKRPSPKLNDTPEVLLTGNLQKPKPKLV